MEFRKELRICVITFYQHCFNLQDLCDVIGHLQNYEAACTWQHTGKSRALQHVHEFGLSDDKMNNQLIKCTWKSIRWSDFCWLFLSKWGHWTTQIYLMALHQAWLYHLETIPRICQWCVHNLIKLEMSIDESLFYQF